MDLKKIRQDLHQIPEIAFDVFKTKDYIVNLFADCHDLKIRVLDFNAIIIDYNQGGDEPYFLFRADMDALPIKENSGCDFESLHDNMMHACGHDIHMTVLIGLIDRVVQAKIKKNIIFIFQPGEEGHGGALKIIESGVLQKHVIAECYALHVAGEMEVGKLACKPGIIFGIPQEFDILFKGVSSHIANPQNGKDALLAGVDFYTSMKQLIPQSFSPIEPIVFQIGKAEAGVVRNSIASKCLFQGTHRTLSPENRDKINAIMQRVAQGVAKGHDLHADVKLLATFDPVINDSHLYNKFISVVDNTDYSYEECNYTLTGEDFGFFTTNYPGLLFWLGSGDLNNSLHSDKFLPKQEAVDIGIDMMWRLLNYK